MLREKDILFEDKDIFVCKKLAGIATQTAKIGEQDMVSLIKNYLKVSYIGIVHRLDQPVEGILIVAKTQLAAAKLSRQFAEKDKVEKRYYALVYNERKQGKEEACKLIDYLVKDGKNNTSKVVASTVKEAKKAELEYRICQKAVDKHSADVSRCALAEIFLKTGRHHQIRVQMANIGMPLLGDKKYGNEESLRISREKNISDIALCAYFLSFSHPITGKKMHFEIAPENPAFMPFLPVNP